MPKKILIVDDSFEDSSLMKSILSGLYSVFVATNGAQALDMMKPAQFDLVLIDVKMPTLSGYDLSRLLREKYNGRTKLCYVTIVPKKEVDMAGVNGFVQKPFRKEGLLKEVKNLIG